VSIVACASASCAASSMYVSSRSEVKCWVGIFTWAALNPAIFFHQEAILAFGGILLNNLNLIIISLSVCKYDVI
jgi:hypothetical protein